MLRSRLLAALSQRMRAVQQSCTPTASCAAPTAIHSGVLHPTGSASQPSTSASWQSLAAATPHSWAHSYSSTSKPRKLPPAPIFPDHFMRLNSLQPAPGAVKEKRRVGRGNASGRGNYCGRGVKGQKSRRGGSPGLLFDGGTKELRKFPKMHARPGNPVNYDYVNLETVQDWVQRGRLDASQVITMKDLRDSGAVSKTLRWGVKLLARGGYKLSQPLHLQVSATSEAARAAVEAAGGSVTTVYYNRLGLRALLKPEAFEVKGRDLPRAVRAWPPRENGKFDVIGQLPPTRDPPQHAPLLQPTGIASSSGAERIALQSP